MIEKSVFLSKKLNLTLLGPLENLDHFEYIYINRNCMWKINTWNAFQVKVVKQDAVHWKRLKSPVTSRTGCFKPHT